MLHSAYGSHADELTHVSALSTHKLKEGHSQRGWGEEREMSPQVPC